MRSCLEDEELFGLVDGALSEKDACLLREHVHGCASCTKNVQTLEHAISCLAEEESLDVERHAAAVLAAIDQPRAVGRPRSWTSRVIPIGIGALAAAAALVLGIGISRRSDDGFTARGGAVIDASLRRGAALTVQTLDNDKPRVLVAGSKVTRGTRFVGSHRNVGSETPYALVFGVDSQGTVHWLYPAYESTGTDPSSVPLAPTAGSEVLMGTGVSFEDMSEGRLSIVTLLSRQPLTVSKVEGRATMGLEALRRDFPEADVSSIDVEVVAR